MMKYLSIFLFLHFTVGAFAAGPDPDWTTKVGAHAFPDGKARITVHARDSSQLATTDIQHAIDACAAKGGGVVVFEPGIYKTGSIFVKEGVELRIDKGVELIGSQRFEDYP